MTSFCERHFEQGLDGAEFTTKVEIFCNTCDEIFRNVSDLQDHIRGTIERFSRDGLMEPNSLENAIQTIEKFPKE